MTTQEAVPEQARPLEVDPAAIGVLELGEFEVPYVDLEGASYVHSHLVVDGTEYVYQRSYPIRGHSAVMPDYVRDLLAAGRQIIVAERDERYIVYAA